MQTLINEQREGLDYYSNSLLVGEWDNCRGRKRQCRGRALCRRDAEIASMEWHCFIVRKIIKLHAVNVLQRMKKMLSHYIYNVGTAFNKSMMFMFILKRNTFVILLETIFKNISYRYYQRIYLNNLIFNLVI